MTEEKSVKLPTNTGTKTKAAHCDKHGGFESHNRFGNHWSSCPTCRSQAEEARKMEEIAMQEADEKRRKQERFRNLVEISELPFRFHDRTLDSYIAETPEKKRALAFAKEYADDFKTVYETGRCALFIGRPGTGKTHLAAGIALQLMSQYYSVRYTTVSRLIRRIRSTWRRASEESENQAINAFTRPNLLILDEVGVQYGSDAEKIALFDVLNERYESRMPTLLISNRDKNGVAESLGELVFDRLREDDGHVIAFNWESERHKIAVKVTIHDADVAVPTPKQKASSHASSALAGG